MVSIIIPVYNTGKILNKCLRSVVCQTYTDWECIIVNDASNDIATIKVLKKWRSCNPKFIFIDKPVNEGVDAARFSAITISKGDYVTFVDSDDWLEPQSLEIMVTKACETDADLIVGRVRKVYWGGYSRTDKSVPEWMGRIICHNELMQKYYISFFGVALLPINMWAKLYKRDLFVKACIQPSKLIFGEDLIVNMRLFPHIKTFYAIDKIIYNYKIGLPGISDKYLDSWLENARKLHELKMQTLLEANYKKGIYYQKRSLVNYIYSYINICIRYRRKQRKENILALKKELSHPIYKELATLYAVPSYQGALLALFIANGKADELYSIIEQNNKYMPILQKIFYSILCRIRH